MQVLGVAGVVHSEDVHDGQHSVANEEDVNDNNITNMADHVQSMVILKNIKRRQDMDLVMVIVIYMPQS